MLLKNDGATLPLARGGKLAVLGPHANATRALVGNYLGQAPPPPPPSSFYSFFSPPAPPRRGALLVCVPSPPTSARHVGGGAATIPMADGRPPAAWTQATTWRVWCCRSLGQLCPTYGSYDCVATPHAALAAANARDGGAAAATTLAEVAAAQSSRRGDDDGRVVIHQSIVITRSSIIIIRTTPSHRFGSPPRWSHGGVVAPHDGRASCSPRA